MILEYFTSKQDPDWSYHPILVSCFERDLLARKRVEMVVLIGGKVGVCVAVCQLLTEHPNQCSL